MTPPLSALEASSSCTPGTRFVLPTVWDVRSARTAVAAGFPALSLGSRPLADCRGACDNEGRIFEEVLASIIPRSVAVSNGHRVAFTAPSRTAASAAR